MIDNCDIHSNNTRYQGHISLREIGEAGQAAIVRGKVLIVGAGGLGSPVSLYLAAAGVGHIGIVDADTVSLSNLQRQIMHGTDAIGSSKVESAKAAMLHINPIIEVSVYKIFLNSDNAEKLFNQYDIIVDCTDNFCSRMLISDVCVKLAKPYVYGAVSRFQGQVFTHIPGSADFRAFFGEELPENNSPCSASGILNSLVGVTGTLQATEVIKYLTGAGEMLVDRLLVYDLLTMQFNTLDI